jgi:hypothetical protein
MRLSRNQTSPPGPVDQLQESVDVLFWIRKTLSIIPDLPDGKIKDDLVQRISELQNGNGFETPLTLRTQVSTLQSTITELRSKIKSLEDTIKDSKPREDTSEPDPDRGSGCGKFGAMLILIILSFFLGSYYGADLDLGGARRTPDALAVPPK